MSEKLESSLPIPLVATPAKRAHCKNGKKVLVAGALIGAALLFGLRNAKCGARSKLIVHPAYANHQSQSDDLRNWITSEADFGNRKIFDQLGPTAGAAEGLVIAAPSKDHPDYFYTWTRDSAIVTGTIVDRLLAGEIELEAALRLYAYSQAGLQKICNPSGCPTTGGLGEPKFNVDGTAFTGGWGRPQRDGPALRAITLTRFANYLLDRGTDADHAFVSRFLYNQDTSSGNSIIKNDLEFSSHQCFWDDSFDLWEEVQDQHFFTLLSCRKALQVGSALASRLNDQGAAAWYTQQSGALTSLLLESKFRFPDGSYRAYANARQGRQNDRRGVDSAVLLGILAAGDAGDANFGPTAPAVLASIKVYVDAFRGLYSIASSDGQKKGPDPVPTGRYPEDKWDGYDTNEKTMGNPWYICTVAVPHLVDLALAEFVSKGEIKVTNVSLPFFKQFGSVNADDVLHRGSSGFNSTIQGMRTWSDGFYSILRQFQGPGGQLYEQFNKNDGKPQGAPNLTWSFGAFANAARARHSLASFLD